MWSTHSPFDIRNGYAKILLIKSRDTIRTGYIHFSLSELYNFLFSLFPVFMTPLREEKYRLTSLVLPRHALSEYTV